MQSQNKFFLVLLLITFKTLSYSQTETNNLKYLPGKWDIFYTENLGDINVKKYATYYFSENKLCKLYGIKVFNDKDTVLTGKWDYINDSLILTTYHYDKIAFVQSVKIYFISPTKFYSRQEILPNYDIYTVYKKED